MIRLIKSTFCIAAINRFLPVFCACLQSTLVRLFRNNWADYTCTCTVKSVRRQAWEAN